MNHKRRKKWMLLWALSLPLWPGAIRAQLEFQPDEAPRTAFPGEATPVAVRFHNPAAQPVETGLRTRLYQVSSATVIPLGEPQNWKKLQVLPGQTVLESTPLTFPVVKEATSFLVQWLDEKSEILGKTTVMVYPTNLLQALKPLAGEKPLGVFDPQNRLKPLLKSLDVEFADLADVGLNGFSGKLVIIGPFQSRAQMYDGLADQIQALAKKGKAVVWLQLPPPATGEKLQPSFYTVLQKRTGLVIVQPGLVANLSENPQSQLNLIYFCQLALNPQSPALPALSLQP